MPRKSLGFWVATTMNGSGSLYWWPSMETWFSLMASRSADCVLGLVRLISSASTMEAKMGPFWNLISPESLERMVYPRRSAGIMSGVSWTLEKEASIDFAREDARRVLPTPGTSSRSAWPLARRQQRSWSMESVDPR